MLVGSFESVRKWRHERPAFRGFSFSWGIAIDVPDCIGDVAWVVAIDLPQSLCPERGDAPVVVFALRQRMDPFRAKLSGRTGTEVRNDLLVLSIVKPDNQVNVVFED